MGDPDSSERDRVIPDLRRDIDLGDSLEKVIADLRRDIDALGDSLENVWRLALRQERMLDLLFKGKGKGGKAFGGKGGAKGNGQQKGGGGSKGTGKQQRVAEQ